MNWQHIESIFSKVKLYRSRCGDSHLLTNGFIALAVPEAFMLGSGEDYPKLAALWADHSAATIAPLGVGACSGDRKQIIRAIGEFRVAERLFRCFESGDTWSTGTPNKGGPDKGKHPLLVHSGQLLVGVVMPVSSNVDWMPIPEPTDDDVFSPYASEENGWYLLSADDLASEIAQAEEELEEWREKVEDAEAEVEGWEETIASLRHLRQQRKARLNPVEAA